MLRGRRTAGRTDAAGQPGIRRLLTQRAEPFFMAA